jgi:lipid A 3-O-deacylase
MLPGGQGVVRKLAGWAATTIAAILTTDSGFAADAAIPWLDEMRVGGTMSASTPLSASVEAQALFSPLPTPVKPYDPYWSWLFSPRPFLGASISAEGKTDFAYAGLDWIVPIRGPFFGELTAGGAVHDQTLNKVYDDRPWPMTTRFLFRESAALGYQINTNWRILAFVDHASNGDFGYRNIGVNRLGMLLGYKLAPSSDKSISAPANDKAISEPSIDRFILDSSTGQSVLDSSAAVPAVGSNISAFNWAGLYAGPSVALAHGTLDFATPPGAVTSNSVNIAGQGGYNWARGPLVMGIEADYAVQNMNGAAGCGGGNCSSVSASSLWLVTARGRIGADVQIPNTPNRFLLYATGGEALSRIANSYCAHYCYDLQGNVSGGWLVQAQLRSGWTAGGGVELPMAPNVTVKIEYLHVDFGKLGFSNVAVAAESFTFSQQIIRTGMNFKFN